MSHEEYIKSLWSNQRRISKTPNARLILTKDNVKLLQTQSHSPERINYNDISIIASKRNP